MSWRYDPEALADWLDKQFDENEELQDKWWRQSVGYGKLQPFWQSVATVNRYTGDLGFTTSRIGAFATRGFIDVLRFGTDISLDQSAWQNFKGVASNTVRFLAVSGPIMRLGGSVVNGIGLRAASRLKNIPGATAPCSWVAANNILSYLSGKTIQFFATVQDIKLIREANKGHAMGALLSEPEMVYFQKELGLKLKALKIERLEKVVELAKASDSPMIVSVEWVKPDGQLGKHAITLAKDEFGNLKFLDFFDNAPGFRGFNSIAEMAAARPFWGPNFAQNLRVIPGTYVFELSTRLLRLMPVADGFALASPIVLAAQWTEGNTAQQRVHNMMRSAWQFVSQAKQQSLVPPPLPSPKTLDRIEILNNDSIVTTGLGLAPRAPLDAATAAPRFDWLTGVQYRLRFLNYYAGEVNGKDDEATRKAVLAFQREWFKTRADWDGIPGPRTQARLKLIVGW